MPTHAPRSVIRQLRADARALRQEPDGLHASYATFGLADELSGKHEPRLGRPATTPPQSAPRLVAGIPRDEPIPPSDVLPYLDALARATPRASTVSLKRWIP